MDSLIFIITLLFLVAGICYGLGAGTIKSSIDVINGITKTFAALAGLIFMLLLISQFIAYFNFSNMPTVVAVKMADLLERADIGAIWLLIGFILVIAILDIIIPGVVPKWAIFAPIFIPLFMRLDVAPQTVLAAYRVGDSPVNVITPLMVYLPFIVLVAQRYKRSAGIGTIISLMIPYTFILLIALDALLRALVPARHPASGRATRSTSEVSDVAFDPVPSVAAASGVRVAVAGEAPATATAVGIPVVAAGPVPERLGVDREGLAAAGFDGRLGQALALPQAGGPVLIAVGIGDFEALDATALRDAGGGVRARREPAPRDRRAGCSTSRASASTWPARRSSRACCSRATPTTRCEAPAAPTPLESLTLLAVEDADALAAGAERGRVLAAVGSLARDLVNTPHSHLNATGLAELAVAARRRRGASWSSCSTRTPCSSLAAAACWPSTRAASSRRG